MIDHDVVRLHVTMHHAICMRERQCNQQLVDVIADVHIRECWIQDLEVRVGHMLKNEAGCFRPRVPHSVQKLDHIGPPPEILQDLDLTLDLSLPHGLEALDDNLVLPRHLPSFKYLTVLAPPNLPHDLVILAIVPMYGHRLVVRVSEEGLRAGHPGGAMHGRHRSHDAYAAPTILPNKRKKDKTNKSPLARPPPTLPRPRDAKHRRPVPRRPPSG
mmetsp:Transcript_21970/g.54128  ORF Transcript_21970/g.54128 Transcript_21970/m.54128 type:complete len:215 (+) Transcript_21970:1020-1664(+)